MEPYIWFLVLITIVLIVIFVVVAWLLPGRPLNGTQLSLGDENPQSVAEAKDVKTAVAKDSRSGQKRRAARRIPRKVSRLKRRRRWRKLCRQRVVINRRRR